MIPRYINFSCNFLLLKIARENTWTFFTYFNTNTNDEYFLTFILPLTKLTISSLLSNTDKVWSRFCSSHSQWWFISSTVAPSTRQYNCGEDFSTKKTISVYLLHFYYSKNIYFHFFRKEKKSHILLITDDNILLWFFAIMTLLHISPASYSLTSHKCFLMS